MAVVVKNAKKGIIFGFDGWKDKFRILNLETHFMTKPFDIKLLNKRGIDIVASGNPFISDVVFNDTTQKDKLKLDFYEDEENYTNYTNLVIKILERDYQWRNHTHFRRYYLQKHEMSVVDYEDPNNWALTYKMRGFKDVRCKPYPRSHPMMNSYTASGLLNVIKKQERNEHIKIKPTVDVEHRHRLIFKNDCKFGDLRHQRMCVYVEHTFTIPTELEVRERTIDIDVPERSKVLDFYSGGTMYGTMIEISMSPQITDYQIHSDEGYYNAVVNYYNKKRGIVLLGEQNNEVMYYGNALNDGIYIPDVLYEFH